MTQHLGISPDVPRTVERGGTTYEMNPRASAKPAEPPPALDAEPAPLFDAPPSSVVRAGAGGS